MLHLYYNTKICCLFLDYFFGCVTPIFGPLLQNVDKISCVLFVLLIFNVLWNTLIPPKLGGETTPSWLFEFYDIWACWQHVKDMLAIFQTKFQRFIWKIWKICKYFIGYRWKRGHVTYWDDMLQTHDWANNTKLWSTISLYQSHFTTCPHPEDMTGIWWGHFQLSQV